MNRNELISTVIIIHGNGSGDRFFEHTGTVHGGLAVLLSCDEFVVMILYCIYMLDMKYACCRVDMCFVG